MKYKISYDAKLSESKLDFEKLKKIYGPQIVVTLVGKSRIIHLDRPSEETIRKRVEEVKRDDLKDPNECWDIIYDDAR